MSLGAPWMLLLLVPVALSGRLMARARRLQREAACRLKGVAPEGAQAALGRRDWLALASLACAVLALARPQWNPRPYDVERRGRDLVIALDVSRSMLAADIFPSRLEAARIAIHEALPALSGQRIALITFAGSASVRVPLTLDHDFVRYMLERADPADVDVGSTSLQAAFEKAAGTVLIDAEGGRRDMVVFTDGEDHLSDIEKATEVLSGSGARVLLIGLGDPAHGARVPDAAGTNQWMRHKDAVVISRLDEGILAKLSGKSQRVTYHPARTRPFDLVPLYRKMIAGAAGDAPVGKFREVNYTEGYPYLLGLAVALWFASLPLALPAARNMALIALLLHGCARRVDEGGEAAFRERFKRGGELLQYAQEQSAIDSTAARSLLVDAREECLRAGLLRPGDIEAARRITDITRRLRELDAAIAGQRAEETRRRDQIADIIGRLGELTAREARLSQRSRALLRRRPAPPKAELDRLAAPVSIEQRAVRDGTTNVLATVAFHQNTLRQLLVRAYGDTGKPPPTELDAPAGLLVGAAEAQRQALASLAPGSDQWPQANSAFHAAAGRMQQALEALRGQQPPKQDQEDGATRPMGQDDYNEDMDWSDPDDRADKARPTSSGEFKTALSLRSLPIPNYTSEEIMAEESANQEKRARQKAARAGAKVEKNW